MAETLHCGCPVDGDHLKTCPTIWGAIMQMREAFKGVEIDLTPCQDCGASPKQTRCDCDHAGIRVQRELDSLRQRLADTEQANRVLRDEYQQMEARAVEAERERDAARADTRRLDWLDAKRTRGQVWEALTRGQSATYVLGTYNGGCVERNGDVRAVIDAAIAAEGVQRPAAERGHGSGPLPGGDGGQNV